MSRAKRNNPRRRDRESRFDTTVEAMRRRIESLLGDAGKALRRKIPEGVAQDLQSSLEELQVAEEELRQQNEELVAAQQAVLQERARYAGLFEFAPDGYLVTDMQGIIREANRAAGALLARPPSSLVSKPLGVYVSPGDRKLFRAGINALGRGTFEKQMELRLRRQKAEEFWAAVSVAVVDDGDRPVGLRWLFRDVTERKQAESDVREARDLLEARVEERTADLAKAMEDLKGEARRREEIARFPDENPAPVLRVAKDGTLLYANPASAGLLKDWKTAVGSPVPEAWRARVRKALRSKKTQDTDVEQGGRVFSVFWAPVAAEGYVNLYFRDVTDRRRAQAAADASAELARKHASDLDAIFRNMADAVLFYDDKGDLRRCNAKAQQLLGVDREEPHLGRADRGKVAKARNIRHPDGRPAKVEELPSHRALAGETVRDQRFLMTTPEGREVVLDASASLLKTDGRVEGAVVVWHDVTERRRRELELARVNRTLMALSRADRALLRAGTEKEFLDEACRIVVEDCGHAMVWIGFAEPDAAKSIRPAAWAGFEEGYLDTLKLTWDDSPRGRGPTGTAIRTGRPCACTDMLADPAFAPWKEEAIQRGYASSLALPLAWGKRVLGAITIYFPRPGAVSDDELRLLSALADDVAFGVEALRTREAHAKAAEAVRRSSRRSELLAATASELLVTWEPQRAIEDLCRRVMDHLDCQAFFNFLVDEKAGRLRLNACGGIPEEMARRIEWLDYGVAVCGCVARDGERIIAEHIPTTPDPRTEMIKSFGIKAYCCHPLFGPGGNVIGTLSFGTKTRETFSEEDVSLMSAVSDQVAAAMARVRSEREVREARDGLEAKVRERTSELESAMQALRDSSAYARTLLEASLDPLVTISPEGQITDVNLAAVIVTGMPREGLIGTDFADYFTEPDRARAGCREVFAEGMVTEYPLTLRHRNGRLTEVVYNATVYRDASGAVQGVFAAARDVTERNRVRRAIEVSEARHRAVMEEAAEGILLTDGEGNIVEANVSVSRITGRSVGELAGKNVADLLTPEEIGRHPLRFEEVRAGRTVSEERRLTRTDGATVYIESSSRILQDGRILVVVRDITERRRAEDMLREYQARLKSMATELALLEERQRSAIARDLHDGISQTLAAAKMRLDLMKSKGAQSADFAEVHRLVAQSLEESRSLTIDLCPPVLYDLGLDAALEYLVERFAGETGIETEFESDGEPKPLTDGLRAMLYRSTRELLRNASKHSRATKIRVSTRRENGSAVVEVGDDGAGFDASSVGAGMHPGGGFGLFSIREQLNYLGGSLDVRSEPGAGTRAILTAPLAPDNPKSGEAS